MTWSDDSSIDSDPSKSDLEEPKCIAFMARANISSVQGSSDKYSKSDEDLTSHEFFDDEQDLETKYRMILKDSLHLIRINDKMTHKLKHMESMSSTLSFELEDVHTKVS